MAVFLHRKVSCFIFLHFLLLIKMSTILLAEKCSSVKWGPWRCPGFGSTCYSNLAIRYKCPDGKCTENSPCTTSPTNQETMDCEKALTTNKCKPWYGPWLSWTTCDATCGDQDRTRRRACRGAFTENSKDGTCQDKKYVDERRLKNISGSVETKSCPSKMSCPLVHGNWGEWSGFSSCDVSCGQGVRLRTRQCNNPPPSRFGRPCVGSKIHQIPCTIRRPCPRNGDWCPWIVIRPCNDICRYGIGNRIRFCACPRPMYGGLPCNGNKRKTFFCNEAPCIGNFTLTEKEEQILKDFLYNRTEEEMWTASTGTVAMLGDYMNFECPKDILPRTLIFDKKGRFPTKPRYHWVHNGKPIKTSKHNISKRYVITSTRLDIRKIRREDLGVYVLVVDRYRNHYSPLCYFILYTDDIHIELHAGQAVKLDGNVKGLDIVANLDRSMWRMEWTFTPDMTAIALGAKKITFFKVNRMHGPFSSLSVQDIRNVRMSMSGVYTCQLYREPTGNNSGISTVYTTSRIRLVVKKPLSYWYQAKIWMYDNRWYIIIDSVLAFVITVYSSFDIRTRQLWEARRQ